MRRIHLFGLSVLLLSGSMLSSPRPASAGVVGNVFINENITINAQGGFNQIVFIGKIVFIDPFTINTTPGQDVNPFHTNPAFTATQTTIQGKPAYMLQWSSSSGATLPTDDASNKAITYHVGFGENGASMTNHQKVVEDPGIYHFYEELKNPTTGKTKIIGLPALDSHLSTTTVTSMPTKYVITTATVTNSAGASVTEWYEDPVTGNQPYKVDFTNPGGGGGALTLSNAKYFLSDTQIPLDQLNMQDLPPTDSRFQSVPGYSDGTILQPTPEPSALALATIGVIGAGAFAWRRRRRGTA